MGNHVDGVATLRAVHSAVRFPGENGVGRQHRARVTSCLLKGVLLYSETPLDLRSGQRS